MNIVQVSSGELKIPIEKGGGVEAYIFGISKQLSKMGHSVTILDRKYSSSDPDVERIDCVKMARLSARRFARFNFIISFVLNQISFGRQVKKYLAEADYDVINVHFSINGLILATMDKNLRNRLFYTSHASRRSKYSLNLLDKMALALENQLVKRTTKTLVLNEPIRGKLISAARVKPEEVVLLPVSIDTSRFNPDENVGDIRQRYGFEGKFAILFVGRICADKGVEYLVKAANIVVNELGNRDVRFLLVGPVEQFGSMEETASPYFSKVLSLIEHFGLQGSIRLTGPVPFDDLRKLYAACDIFVLPSLAEAAPTSPLEAMASGKPVIGTKVGGIPMEVEDGQSGLLVDPADERQLAERIRYLINNPEEAKKMGAYGRKIVEERFDSAKTAKRLLQVYQGMD
ncbi:glycosyltransferase family 4 protein [Chloroflexota bacterium]